QGSFDSGLELLYAHVETDPANWTGLVALNVGDTTSSIHFTLYDAQGQALETQTRSNVAPNTKITLLASALFSPQALAQGAWVRAEAEGSEWAGFQLWGDLKGAASEHLAGLEAWVLP